MPISPRLSTLALCVLAARYSAHAAHVAAPGDEFDEGDVAIAEPPKPSMTPRVQTGPLLKLDQSNFEATVYGTKPTLVEFYAPWCGLCKTINPEYERAARIAANASLDVNIASVDVTEPGNSDIASELAIKTLPQIVLFRDGASEKFPVLSTAEAFTAGLDRILNLGRGLTPVKEITESADEAAGWIFWRGTGTGQILTTLILYAPAGLEGAAAAAAAELEAKFVEVAHDLHRFSNLRFAKIASRDILVDFEMPLDKAQLVLYVDHDEGRFTYDGPLDFEAIRMWMLMRDVPLVAKVSHRELQPWRKRTDYFGLFFVDSTQIEDAPTMDRVRRGLLSVAQRMEAKGKISRGRFTIGIADGDKYRSWMRMYALDDDAPLPAFGVEVMATKKFYGAPDGFAELAARLHAPPGARLSSFLPAANGSALIIGADGTPEAVDMTGADSAETEARNEAGRQAGFTHASAMYKPLTWVEVPVDILEGWMDQLFAGQLTPAVPLPEPDYDAIRAANDAKRLAAEAAAKAPPSVASGDAAGHGAAA